MIKGVSLGIYDITMLSLPESSKLGEEIGCMEVTSPGVSKIAIKVFAEANILGLKELCD